MAVGLVGAFTAGYSLDNTTLNLPAKSVASGNAIVVFIISSYSYSPTVYDNLGNTYEPLYSYTGATSSYVYVWVSTDIDGGSCTLTADPYTGEITVFAYEVSGLPSSPFLDMQEASASQSATVATTPNEPISSPQLAFALGGTTSNDSTSLSVSPGIWSTPVVVHNGQTGTGDNQVGAMSTYEISTESSLSVSWTRNGTDSRYGVAVLLTLASETVADVITIDLGATYVVGASADFSRTAVYEIESEKDYTRSATYGVPSDESLDMGAVYVVGAVGEEQVSAEYSVLASLDITKMATYTIPVGDFDETLDADYAVAVSTDETQGAEYVVYKVYDETLDAEYDVGGFGSVDLEAVYTVLSYPTLGFTASYRVDAGQINKTFFAKVYDPSGNFLKSWHGIIVSDLLMREEINMAGAEVPLELARVADDFGEGEDVNYRNKVELYIVDKEAPNGKLKFTGFISSFEPDYANEKVNITLLSYGADMSRTVMEDGSGNTTIAYASEDPADILRDILDNFVASGGNISYDVDSIDDTATTVSYTFNTNTVKEGVDKVLQLAPDGWYYYIDQATNLLHFHERSTTPDHTFAIGKDITDLKIKKSIEPVVNTLYFSGGDTGSGIFYKKYELSSSITNYGVQAGRYKDGRVTLEATADIIASKVLRGDPEILVTVSVADSNLNDVGYDLESIKIGETAKIGSSGIGPSSLYDVAEYDNSPYDYDLSNLSSIVFQITSLDYRGGEIGFTLSTTPPDITKRIQDITRNLADIQNSENPTAPSV